ncbi:MAG TPA: hypothetical protein VF042_10020, partial [Gemmatimonadaceae bacterium]
HAVGGAAIDATSTTFSGAGFVSTTSSGSTGRGISLTNVSGTLALGSGSIGTAAAEDFFVSGGAATISYGGNITNTASRSVSISGITGGSITLSGNITDTGTGALIQNNTGGTISFSGATKVFNTGTNTAIALSTNTGATVSLVDSVKVTTTSGAGISASGGGILTITGSHNAISTTTGKALSVVSTTIGGLGLTFRSISANGAANGIELNTTGSGGLTVTGGSGLCGYVRATDVENTSGCDGGTITATTGSGISLTSASNVSLTRMRVTSAGGHGLFGQTVANLIVANSVFSGNGNETAGDGEGGIQLYDLSGTSSVTNTLVENSAAGNMFVSNSASTPLTLSATGNKFELANLNDGLAILGFNSASITGTVNNNKFVANKGDHFQAAPANSTTMTLTISGNRMEGSHPTVLGGGVTLRGGGTYVGTFTYDFVGDTVFDSKVTAITTGLGSSAPPGKILGKIRNSLFGRDGVTNSGSLQGSCLEGDIDTGTGTVTLLVDNNKFFRCFDRGMQFFGAKGGNGILNVTAKNNTVSQLLDVNSRHAIHAETGSSLNVETATTCYDFSSNNLTGQASNGDIRIRQRSFAPIGFPGYAGGAADDAAVANYLIARNTLNSATKVTASHTISNAYSNAGASCPTPP